MACDESSRDLNDYRRKRHRKQASEDAYVCWICGDEAASYNFGAICCESCKAFYRRSLTSQRTYSCASGDRCVINKQTRKLCPGCRMRKCCEVGMSSDPLTVAYIREMQSGARPRRKFTRKNSQPGDSPDGEASPSSSFSNLPQDATTASLTHSDEVTSYQSMLSSRKAVDNAAAYYNSDPALDSSNSKPRRRNRAAESVCHLPEVATRSTIGLSCCVKKQELDTNCAVSDSVELTYCTQEEYLESLDTCCKFTEVMAAPFSASDLGPVDTLMPDDPISLSRFPEATLRKFVSALKIVAEFQQCLTASERFWLLKAKMVRHVCLTCGYVADPFQRVYSGVTWNGFRYRHTAEYVLEQVAKLGVDFSVLIDSSMNLYHRIRESFPAEAEWSTVLSFLCILKLFAPDFAAKAEEQPTNDVDIAQLLVKSSTFYRKYNTMFKHYVQSVFDSRAGKVEPWPRRVTRATDWLCESLQIEAADTCEKGAVSINQMHSIARSPESASLVPLFMELIE